MFNRHEFLEGLAELTTIERGDVWCLLSYLLVMGPMSRPTLRSAFYFMRGSFDAYLHFLVKHQAVKLHPDQWDGEPEISVKPEVGKIIISVNGWKHLLLESPEAVKSA